MRSLGISFALALAACAEGQAARAPSFDAPIPAAEPRATLKATLDLAPVSDCDERFDLALYEERGVELVTWDEARGCTGRRIVVRYVPARVSRDALIRAMQKASRRVEVTA
jgi:hypothetical protein